MQKSIFVFVGIMVAGIAVGQDAAYSAAEYGTKGAEMVSKWPFLQTVVAWAVAVHFALYAGGEALTRFAVLTSNKWDNKAAAMLSQAAWFLGSFMGKFGFSVPKKVMEEKASRMKDEEKDASVGK